MDCICAASTYRKAGVYSTPRIIYVGTLREMTLIGCGPDHDGGIFGIADGQLRACFRSS